MVRHAATLSMETLTRKMIKMQDENTLTRMWCCTGCLTANGVEHLPHIFRQPVEILHVVIHFVGSSWYTSSSRWATWEVDKLLTNHRTRCVGCL